MYVGPGVSGAVWYEIGTVSRAGYDVELIVHAMKARKGYLRKEHPPMRFEDLPKAERDALAEYGYEVAAEMEAMDEPAPGDPTLDPRYDPSLRAGEADRTSVTPSTARSRRPSPPAAATASRGTPSDARSASPPRPRGGAMAFARPRV